MAEALTSAFGNRPDQLENPVPGEGQEEQFLSQLSKIRTPRLDTANLVPPNEAVPPSAAAAQTAAQEDLDLFAGTSLADELFAGTSFAAEGKEDAPTVETPSLSERLEGGEEPVQAVKSVIGDSFARLKASFAVTDFEKSDVLQKIYGADNVRMRDGEPQIRRPGEKGFRDFDPKNFELINDVLDFGRDVVEGSIELGGRIGGGIVGAVEAVPVGAVVGAPAGPLGATAGAVTTGALGAIAGQAAGGAAASALAVNVGDFIAQGLLDIERDPLRSRVQETGAAGAVGAIFAGAAGALTRKRIAQEAKKGVITPQKVLADAKELEQSVDSLARNGINLRQGKMALSPGQAAGRLSPEALTLDKELSTQGPVRDFFVEQGRLVGQGWDNLMSGLSNTTGKPAEELFLRTKRASKLSKEIDGALIGDFRSEALAASKNTPLPMAKTQEALPQLLETAGFKLKTTRDAITQQTKQSVSAPSLEELKTQFPDASASTLGEYKAILTELSTKMQKNKGALPLAEVDALYKRMRNSIDNNLGSSSGRQVGASLIGIKNALRDDWAQAIGSELGTHRPGSLEAYKGAMQKYSDIINAQESLRNVLKKSDLSAASFSNHIFSPAQGKSRVSQIKTLIQETDPDIWGQLVDHKMSLITESAKDATTGAMNWQKLGREFEKLDKAEVLDQMIPPESKSLMKNFFNVAQRVDSNFKFKEREPVSKGAVSAARNLIVAGYANVSALAKLGAGQTMIQQTIGSVGKDKAMAKWLAGEGLELVLVGMPKKQASAIRRTMDPLIRQTLRTGARRIGEQTVLRPDSGFQGQELPQE